MHWLHWRPKKPSKAAKALPSDPAPRSFRILKPDEGTGPDVQDMLRQRAYKSEPKKPIAQWRFQIGQPVNIFQVEDLRTATWLHENVEMGLPGKLVHLQDGGVIPRNDGRKLYWVNVRLTLTHNMLDNGRDLTCIRVLGDNRCSGCILADDTTAWGMWWNALYLLEYCDSLLIFMSLSLLANPSFQSILACQELQAVAGAKW